MKLLKTMIVALSVLSNVAHAYSEKEIKCLTNNILYEARGEGVKGMLAVADVTMNRVKSKRFPNTICGVVYQPHQFSWTKQPKQRLKSLELQVEYVLARQLAIARTKGYHKGLTKGSTFYHNHSVSPRWASKMKNVKTIKNHKFYVVEN